ncbi:substrate-binding periplasmic protein [Roseateles flavus]|uniref:Solute-binding protein family 3/N-terminal domain-containing protein n=1 Tax=Roseateles flavus TaxID=3149041 RepID=A0ABV0GIW2_9BURK
MPPFAAVGWVLCLLLLGSSWARAVPQTAPPASAPPPPWPVLRLCTSDSPFVPYTAPDGSGSSQRLLAQALQGLPLRLQSYVAPRSRCLLDARAGQAEALIGVFDPERLAWARYPMRGDQPDGSQALAAGRFLVYRRVGSPADWDGERFSQLQGAPVGVRLGFSYGGALARSAAPIDDKATSAEQLLRKLAKGRVALAIVQEAQGELLRQQGLEAPIEALPRPFSSFELHLILTQRFEQQHPALARQLWQRIGQLRARQAGSP